MVYRASRCPREFVLAGAAAACQTELSMLCLLFQIGQERYAIASSEIAVVLPQVSCKQIPQAPAWVRGIFHYQGRHVPVLDTSMLALGRPAAARLSTRLVLVHYVPPAGGVAQLLGLIVEKATDTLRCEAADFSDSGLVHENARYLGPVMQHQGQLIQLIHVADLLEEHVCALLFAQEDAQEGMT